VIAIAVADDKRILSDNRHKSIQYLLSWIRTQKDELMKNLDTRGSLLSGPLYKYLLKLTLKKSFNNAVTGSDHQANGLVASLLFD
jgi:hypothetical protein